MKRFIGTWRFLRGVAVLVALGVTFPVEGGEVVSAFERLSLGEIKPAGWLRDWCETARDGYTGNMEDVHVDYKRALNPDYRPQSYNWHSWKRDPASGKKTPLTSFYCAEAAAYWFPGLIRLAYQLDDPKLKEIVRRRVDPYLPRITTNTVGFAFWLDRNNPADFKLGAVWQFSAVSQFARGLVDYYSAVRDERLLIAAERMVDDPNAYRVAAKGDHYLGLAHAAYDIMQFRPESSARAAFDDYCLALTSGKRPSHCYRFSEPLEKHVHDLCLTAPNHGQNWQHGVIAHEEMLSYLCVYLQTGDRRLLDNLLAWREYLDSHCRQPHGAPVCDEFFGATGGERGTETCDVMSDLAFRCEFLAALGDGRWGDDAERNFFNAVPACVSRDFKRHCYFQVPNMPRRDRKFVFSTGSSSWCTMTRDRAVLCCASNTNRLLPEYIRYSWLRLREGGLAAALWCPCDVSTKVGETVVKVRVRTDYPFGETIAVSVDPSVPSSFTLRLRIPAWCANPAVSVNGERIVVQMDRGFATLDRIWKAGDRIDLTFPMTLRLEGGVDRNNVKSDVSWSSVFHGPLLYALGVPEKDENTPADSSFRTDYALDPKTALASAKIVRKPMPAKWNWPFDAPVRIEGVTAADGAQVALIPYGCTRLRMTMFPESADSFGGRLGDKIAATCEVKWRDTWHGYSRTVFAFDGEEAWVVEPKSGASGRPWCWTMEWPDVFAKRTASLALLAKGYCFVTLRAGEYRNGKFVSKPGNMTDARVERSRAFQKFLVERLGFAPKANLIGMSWGGFYSVRYAAAHPDAVGRIYLDAPLLDFSTLNGWDLDKVRLTYGIADPNYSGAEDPRQPVNLAAPIAKAGIPILLLYGGKDRVVPPERNCELFVKRFRLAGGTISVERRDDYAHHPHGLEVDEQQRFVDFFGSSVTNDLSTKAMGKTVGAN